MSSFHPLVDPNPLPVSQSTETRIHHPSGTFEVATGLELPPCFTTNDLTSALSNNVLINLGDYNVAGVDLNNSNTDLENSITKLRLLLPQINHFLSHPS